MDKELNCISFDIIKKNAGDGLHVYEDKLILADNIQDLSMLDHPCRIDAVVVLICREGEIDCSINLEEYHVRKNMILVNLAGSVIQIKRSEGLEANVAILSSEYLNEIRIDFDNRASLFLHSRKNAVAEIPDKELWLLEPYHDIMVSELKSIQVESSKIIDGLVLAFSHTVLRIMRNYHKELQIEDEQQKNDHLFFERFMGFLHSHHQRERSVKFYADQMALTPKYMSSIIKRYSGKTATEWIDAYVIMEAKLLLKNSDATVKEIAYKLNFSTQSLFGKYFRQHTGMSPRNYRNKG